MRSRILKTYFEDNLKSTPIGATWNTFYVMQKVKSGKTQSAQMAEKQRYRFGLVWRKLEIDFGFELINKKKWLPNELSQSVENQS